MKSFVNDERAVGLPVTLVHATLPAEPLILPDDVIYPEGLVALYGVNPKEACLPSRAVCKPVTSEIIWLCDEAAYDPDACLPSKAVCNPVTSAILCVCEAAAKSPVLLLAAVPNVR